jgi:hypothetical protein
MYSGTLTSLPSYWKVCDGNNGTVDMRGFFLGYSNTSVTAHGATTGTSNISYSASTPAAWSAAAWKHTHFNSNPGVTTVRREYGFHSTATITHGHYYLGNPANSTITPEFLQLAFIQLVLP